MKKSPTSKASQTDLNRLDAMRDDNIDLTEIPEITPEMFAQAIIRQGLKPLPHKEQITLRIDSDVLTWFKAQGRGYQTKINALLRAYMEINQGHS